MSDKIDSPMVFISYAWSSEGHKKWVEELARRLISDGVDVQIDIWDLNLGHDKHVFMERIVADDRIKKVLIICDKTYKEKADNRQGGVGEESIIITTALYSQTLNQEKYIPVVREKDAKGDALKPIYLGTRVHIDFCDDSEFESKYEELLRDIYGVPTSPKPKLGSPPSWTTSSETISLLTTETPATSGFDALFEDIMASFNNAKAQGIKDIIKDKGPHSFQWFRENSKYKFEDEDFLDIIQNDSDLSFVRIIDRDKNGNRVSKGKAGITLKQSMSEQAKRILHEFCDSGKVSFMVFQNGNNRTIRIGDSDLQGLDQRFLADDLDILEKKGFIKSDNTQRYFKNGGGILTYLLTREGKEFVSRIK